MISDSESSKLFYLWLKLVSNRRCLSKSVKESGFLVKTGAWCRCLRSSEHIESLSIFIRRAFENWVGAKHFISFKMTLYFLLNYQFSRLFSMACYLFLEARRGCIYSHASFWASVSFAYERVLSRLWEEIRVLLSCLTGLFHYLIYDTWELVLWF